MRVLMYELKRARSIFWIEVVDVVPHISTWLSVNPPHSFASLSSALRLPVSSFSTMLRLQRARFFGERIDKFSQGWGEK